MSTVKAKRVVDSKGTLPWQAFYNLAGYWWPVESRFGRALRFKTAEAARQRAAQILVAKRALFRAAPRRSAGALP